MEKLPDPLNYLCLFLHSTSVEFRKIRKSVNILKTEEEIMNK
jgi:hypothetical protein